MAEEEVLRMKAVLVDETGKSVANIRKNLSDLGKGFDTSKVKESFRHFTEPLKDIVGMTSTGSSLIAGFSRLGYGVGIVGGAVIGAGVAFAAAAKKLSEFADKMADLRLSSNAIGISTRQLSAFQRAAKDIRIDPSAMTGALQTFAKNAFDFRMRIGELRNELGQLGAGDLVNAIAATTSNMDALRLVFERMQALQEKQPELARRFAESMFGNRDVARLTWKEFLEYNRQLQQHGTLTDENIQKSERFRKSFDDLKQKVDDLGDGVRFRMMPHFTTALDGINAGLDRMIAAFRWLNDHLPSLPSPAPNLNPRSGGAKPQQEQPSEWWRQFLNPQNQNPRSGYHKSMFTPIGYIEPRRPSVTDTRITVEEPVYRGSLRALREWAQTQSGGGVGGGVIQTALHDGGGYRVLPYGGMGQGYGGDSQKTFSKFFGGAAPKSGGPLLGGGGGSTPTTAMQRAAARIVADEWRKAGMSNEGIAGLMANIQDESRFDSTLRHPDQPRWRGEAHYAHGLYQEGGQEWLNYKAWLDKNHPGADWRDARLQSRFAAENLRDRYPHTWKKMLEGNRYQAAAAYVNEYLKPAARYRLSRMSKYLSGGVAPLDKYTGGEQSIWDVGADRIRYPEWRRQQLENAARRRTSDSFDARWNERVGPLMEPKGTVNLNVTAPSGTKVSAESDGFFQDTSITRTKQMSKAPLE
jgi:hypothetical protein